MTATVDIPRPAPAPRRRSHRHYLMCPPTHFAVTYAINPWMDPSAPVDPGRAMAQWQALRRTYQALGHTVEILPALPGLPDMVFAANGGVVVGGRALSSRFRYAERTGEEAAYHDWFAAQGAVTVRPEHVCEGEGDILTVGDFLLVGSGFRSDPDVIAEVDEVLAQPNGLTVVPLELVDPRFYHLDTAMGVLDEGTAAYLPSAFSTASAGVLGELFTDLIACSEADAEVLGLNMVSDGHHVLLEAAATGLPAELRDRGFDPIGIDMSELRKAGGAVKCCTLELRGLTDDPR
ncbi:MAG TPA: arginine deiminase-related protein [Mycobacteriales bacterium]|nr:arginine deiminase-related protein [Mycobacteriales bacterium]